MDTDGRSVRVLVRDGFSGGPAWSPEGERIVFHRDRGDGPEIWIVRSDGTGLRQLTRLRRPPDLGCEQDRWPDWAPDGKTIVFVRLYGAVCEMSQLFTIKPDGHALKPLGRKNLVLEAPRYSPDGRSIVAVGAGGRSIVVLTAEGTPTRSIPIEGIAGPPSWQSLPR